MLKILFQNDHFCAVDKPAEWLSVPSRTGDKDPRPVVGKQLEKDLGRQVWPCHRLDEDVSGILLFALNSKAHKAANQWFEQHTISKTYAALSAHSETLPPPDTIQDWQCRLMRGKRRAYEAEFGKDSHTLAWVVGAHPHASYNYGLWHLQPLTGRSHQLRYEMSRHSWPIIGDILYGSTEAYWNPGIALRAVKLDFSRIKNREEFDLPTSIEIKAFD